MKVVEDGPAGSKIELDDALTIAFKALSDPVRRALYSAIATQSAPTCVCDLPDVGVAQPTVSHHLRKLREAGLITGERRGPWVYYRAAPTALDSIMDFARAHSSSDAVPQLETAQTGDR